MRLRNVKNAKEKLIASQEFIEHPEIFKGKWESIFKNKNQIHLEIGMGKGTFLIEMAQKFPNINFIGIEKYESVLVRAIEKITEEKIPNIRFLSMDAKNVQNVFDKEVSVIYLNFSDPWPKTRHAKRRLTSHDFLEAYDKIFKDTKKIIQKTDNIHLFAFSLEELSKFGYTLQKISLDLEHEKIENVKTEYEEKFLSLGYKINYVEAIKKN